MSGSTIAVFQNQRSFSAPPVNTVAPAVSGTATVGQTLSSTTGTWTGLPTPTFTYQWQRAGSNISGATSSTYVLVNADASNTIRCVVTATNTVSAVDANSNSTASVAAIVPGAPTIGTATSTGSTTATVSFTAPASNGGAAITSYTAVSSPGSITGTLSQAGSGTISVSGLSGGTSYTFTVYATNSAGNSASSSASNSISTPLYAFSNFTFTNAGASGANGPSLATIQSAYSGTSWTQNTAYLNMSTNGYQLWTVPETANYSIDAFGAISGYGSYTGTYGKGARSLGTFALTAGQVIAIAVGQVGQYGGTGFQANSTGAGGGGTFVYNTSSSTLLTVAGGGGGASSCSTAGFPALTGTHAGRGGDNSTTDADYAGGSRGGSSGNGGSAIYSSSTVGGAGGGGGYLSDGATSPIDGNGRYAYGGLGYSNGLIGGVGRYTPDGNGGFGGGGGGGNYGGGGGGGYSGGGAGSSNGYAGGGGASYNSGSNQTISANASSGNGYVVVTKL